MERINQDHLDMRFPSRCTIGGLFKLFLYAFVSKPYFTGGASIHEKVG